MCFGNVKMRVFLVKTSEKVFVSNSPKKNHKIFKSHIFY